MTVNDPATPVNPAEEQRPKKLLGREFYEAIGSPKTIVAPMVDQSEFAWRLLSRRHSPATTLCYTPMFHSRLFATSQIYRTTSFQSPNLDGNLTTDRPTIVQFCSNNPQDLLRAAKLVENHCDAVDLNLGCPQGIARKGRYGAFLQEDWVLIHSLINTLSTNLTIPVTAKLRILDTKEKSLEYAQMIVAAGATVLTIHGRTREQKGHNTGLADWSVIRHIRDNIPREIVIFANGNILWQEDVARCLEATGADGVMSAEGNLYNPAVFQISGDWDKRFPRMDVVGREYLDIVRNEIIPHLSLESLLTDDPSKKKNKKALETTLSNASLTAIKAHLFKLWHTLLPRHTHIRDLLSRASCRRNITSIQDILTPFETLQSQVEQTIAAELRENPEVIGEDGKWVGPDREYRDDDDDAEGIEVILEVGGGAVKRVRRCVPWYRCQPYWRPLPEEAFKSGALKEKKAGRKCTSGGEEGERKRVKVEKEEGVVAVEGE